MREFVSVLAMLAVIHVLGFVGLGAYAYNKGWLAPDRVRAAAAALTGEEKSATTTQPASGEAIVAAPATGAQRIDNIIQRNEEAEERYRIELERRDRELRDAFALLETKWLEVVRQQETLEAQKKQFEAEQERLASEAGNSGLQAEIDTLASVDAKTALPLLRQKDDADVVRILMAMDERKRTKIVKQCKSTEERQWIGRILEQFHENSVAQAEALGAN
ncbi:MAG: hypothetical protein H6819_01875 [Phycisphaerales bacterium]|nr:hypothetical protein [Phycisphaerales bacterium]MCB9857041.1 hypothetical protein [Phycisphaerales bacterium]MCB9861832.1 hypothetical protein [Phycisphaerales bacterium]